MSSASNVFVVLAVARAANPTDFGIFALFFTLTTVLLAMTRGGLGTPISLSSRDALLLDRESSWAIRRGVSFALPFSLIGTILIFNGTSGVNAGGALLLGIPVLLAQDLLRFKAMAMLRPGVAFSADAIWAIASGALLGSTWIFGHWAQPRDFVLLWCAAGALSLVVLWAATKSQRPGDHDLPKGRTRTVVTPADRIRLGIDSAMGGVVALTLTSAVAVILDPLAVAAIRGASTFLGPVNVLISSLQVTVIPLMVRQPHARLSGLLRIAAPVSIPIALFAIILAGTGTFLPTRIGELALGSTWALTAPILLITGIEYLGQSLLTVLLTVLRARNLTRELLRVRIFMGVSQIACGLLGAVLFGTAVGVSSASAVVVWCATPVVLLVVWRMERSMHPAPMHA